MSRRNSRMGSGMSSRNRGRFGQERRRWMAAAGLVLLILGGAVRSGTGAFPGDPGYRLQQGIFRAAEEMYMPGLAYWDRSPSEDLSRWIREMTLAWVPLVWYVEDYGTGAGTLEDEETIARILESQANDENTVDENGRLTAGTEGEDGAGETEEAAGTASGEAVSPDLSLDQLRDFDYLLSHFYTVDSSTMIRSQELDAGKLLSQDLTIDNTLEGPRILVYHTHSQEAFADSVSGDPSTRITGMGEYLTELLNEKGIQTLHDSGVYDMTDGKLDRSKAYEYAGQAVKEILEEYPSIQVIIDLHRDGVGENTHLVTEINGKPTAKIMFFNGLSRSRTNGDIEYLANPYIQDNLAFSLQMQLAAEQSYPGFVRRIYLKAYRYNMHLLPRSLLVEAGAQTNTVEEMRNAMEVLAELLAEVLL